MTSGGPRPPVAAPRCIAVTGGIGSGKSEALRAFAALGASVLSADDVVHRLYLDPDVVRQVIARFGSEVALGGAVDRTRLGAVAFAEPEGLRFLETLIHPRVQATRRAWVAEMRVRKPSPPLLVCEVPLLFEVGAQSQFDAVLVVTASDAVRRARVEQRGQAYGERSVRQVPEAEKVRLAAASFVNDGSVDALSEWVAERFAEYRR